MEKIIAWLNSERDYYQGLALLHEFSKNRQLLQALTRKSMPEKLEYELKKMVPKGVDISKPVKTIKAPPVQQKSAPDRLKIVRNGNTIQLEDLPPRLQKLYLQNTEMYKKMRALHERAKLIKDDVLRTPVTQQLVEYDGKVRENWAVIDSWDGQPDVPGGAIDHRRINANRKFITDNRLKLDQIQPGSERDQLMMKMQGRIDELILAGEYLNRIKADLLKQGFIL
jgi:hypothetical protein